ncbi:MAG: PEP/pyruvate-binding domain-containing protein [Chloroflexi bacterium]|nr:PEP/pyruvate-binding domain-containing protein [Chloroflexota bacterium]
MPHNTDILWLGQPDCHKHELVGGKAANLSLLADNYRVPPGFCLTTDVFEKAVASGAVAEGSNPLPSGVYDQLSEAYTRLAQLCGAPDPSVAVRSSGIDEDSATASFAGQHETYLNIVGAEEIAKAVVDCWASVHSPRAVDYRRRQGLPAEGSKIAVLVQQMVPADVSAIVFGVNPVTGNRQEVVVNAGWGLGESVVGGTVTPDTYVVRKKDMTVASRQVSEKHRMTVSIPGGTREVDVPRFLRTRPAINDDQAIEMARLAMDLEKTMGWPVDIECAYHGDRLYLLQCRPVTTLGAPQ